MRQAFVTTLLELAERDPRTLLLTGDLGYMALEPFAEKYPGRFFNVGVAEQNMLGLATGLAEAGFLPFVYSIATFAVLRPYEFIRNGPVMHQLPVRIVGMGGGLEYGHNGVSHYGLEDVGVLRVQPDMTIIVPADHEQARAALLATHHLQGPVYYRLGKDDVTLVPGLAGRFELGQVEVIRDGADVLFLSMGPVAKEAVGAADALGTRGISCAVVVAATLSPVSVEQLAALLQRFSLAVTVEAHYVTGGLGSLVAEVVAERRLGCRIVRCGVQRRPDGVSGSVGYLYRQFGLSSGALTETVLRELSMHGVRR